MGINKKSLVLRTPGIGFNNSHLSIDQIIMPKNTQHNGQFKPTANTVLINKEPYALTYAEIPEFLNASNALGISPAQFEEMMDNICITYLKYEDLKVLATKQELLFLKEIKQMLQGFLLKKLSA